MHLTDTFLTTLAIDSDQATKDFLNNALAQCIWQKQFAVAIPNASMHKNLARLPFVQTSADSNLSQSTLWVIDDNHLIPIRYWRDKATLLKHLRQKSHLDDQPVYSISPRINTQQQQQAIEQALSHEFTLINGEPGTGKTTIATEIVISLIKKNPQAQIAICAPTAKATRRLESMLAQMSGFNHNNIQINTVHGLMKINPAVYSNKKPFLPFDLLIVDEVSMLSLELAAQLMRASQYVKNMVWLGDANQLPSIDVGQVIEIINEATPHNVCVLNVQYRFSKQTIINQLARSCLERDIAHFKSLLHEETWIEDSQQAWEALTQKASDNVQKWAELVEKSDFQALIDCHRDYVILNPQRVGLAGLEAINKNFTERFSAFGVRPIIVRQNTAHWSNGDMGFAVQQAGQTRYYFNNANHCVQCYDHCPVLVDDAWVLSVHQAQGSEFEEVWLWATSDMNENLLNHKMLYTTITRSKSKVKILVPSDTLDLFFQGIPNTELAQSHSP